MRHRRTAAQLRHEANLIEKEASALLNSLAGMSGRAAIDRSRQTQRCFDKARQLRKLARERQ